MCDSTQKHLKRRFGHCQGAVGKSIFVFGGRMGTSIDEKLLDDLWMFDTDAKTWTEVVINLVIT